MTWLIFAFLNALFESLKDVFSKKGLRYCDEYLVSWALWFFADLVLLPSLFFMPIPELNARFWWALAIGGTLNSICAVLYIKAIKLSDLSITLPIVTFTPIFLFITSPLIVGEFPSAIDFVGVMAIVTGAYFLNLKQRSLGYLAPFRALMAEKGPRLMLVVAFLWSIAANFDKVGLENSSPLFWVISLFSFISVALFPLVVYKSRNFTGKLRRGWRSLALMGLAFAIAVSCQMQAVSMTLVVQAIAIKRTSVLMGVLWGALFFKEKGITERFLGASIMILGVVVMSLF
ncbi:EamA family transporter [Oxynema aestuarii]|jgi:uncharacterized membrane protein|uniref:EamA family transporter n=1 Tax=Oxynema aestuarii AP17 TaxID=2064643 RepID=A0A6H1TT31_9CYAN|nr:EamA family transporter [Oxynema aestuarii]QIZ69701.1 EamA family transporter [Oxynema aestuarii AP17]